jgi:putative addiction module component (TIGR02574 family)
MTDVALRLKDKALELSAEDRVALAHVLLDSVEEHVAEQVSAAEWLAELERRSADADAGRSSEQPFREAIEELRREAL